MLSTSINFYQMFINFYQLLSIVISLYQILYDSRNVLAESIIVYNVFEMQRAHRNAINAKRFRPMHVQWRLHVTIPICVLFSAGVPGTPPNQPMSISTFSCSNRCIAARVRTSSLQSTFLQPPCTLMWSFSSSVTRVWRSCKKPAVITVRNISSNRLLLARLPLLSSMPGEPWPWASSAWGLLMPSIMLNTWWTMQQCCVPPTRAPEVQQSFTFCLCRHSVQSFIKRLKRILRPCIHAVSSCESFASWLHSHFELTVDHACPSCKPRLREFIGVECSFHTGKPPFGW